MRLIKINKSQIIFTTLLKSFNFTTLQHHKQKLSWKIMT